MATPTGFYDSSGRWRATAQHNILLPIFNWVNADNSALAAFANGTNAFPGFSLDNSKGVGLRWNNVATPLAVFTSVLMPLDRQPSTDIIAHVLCWKIGATVGDATTFAISAFANTTAALQDAATDAGGTTGAIVGNAATKTVQHVTLTMLAANLPNFTAAVPTSLTIGLKPTAGLLGTDDLTVSSVWLEYTRIVDPSKNY